MINIFERVTPHPSNYYFDNIKDEYFYSEVPKAYVYPKTVNKYIYVTSSNKDEIIRLDSGWHIIPGGFIKKEVKPDSRFWSRREEYKEILFTNDPKLNEEGIRPLTPEFIKWYIDMKAPSYIVVSTPETCMPFQEELVMYPL
jgi:hypothetical protein